jgi:AraC family transcriptional regulator
MSGARLRRVLSFIEDNLHTDLTLSEIAQVSGLSVTQCQRAFQAALGVSIYQFIISQRVMRAASLLEETGLSVLDVAFATGFSHPSHLSLHIRRDALFSWLRQRMMLFSRSSDLTPRLEV